MAGPLARATHRTDCGKARHREKVLHSPSDEKCYMTLAKKICGAWSFFRPLNLTHKNSFLNTTLIALMNRRICISSVRAQHLKSECSCIPYAW